MDVDWKGIDKILEKGSNGQSFSYRRFYNVTLPNSKPEWPSEEIISLKLDVNDYILEKRKEIAAASDLKELKGKLLEETINNFKLRQTPYSFKKIQDRLRYWVADAIQKVLNDKYDG